MEKEKNTITYRVEAKVFMYVEAEDEEQAKRCMDKALDFMQVELANADDPLEGEDVEGWSLNSDDADHFKVTKH